MKKLISVMLTILMVFSLAVPAFAADEAAETEAYEGYPVVVVRGIDFAGLTYEDGTKALTVNPGDIVAILLETVLAKFKLKDEDALIEGIFEIAESVLSPIAYDNEGNSVREVSMVQYPESMAAYPEMVAELSDETEMGILKTCVSRYGAENTYFFTYDWRKTPEQIASELDSLIETAKNDTGKDKVNIICASMGCMVTTAYMYYCGGEDLNSAVYLSGAQNGTYVAGDSLNGRIHFEPQNLINMIGEATGNNFFLDLLLNILDIMGILDYLTDFINEFVAENFEMANDIVLRDCMGTLIGFWALCPDDDFYTGIEKIFGGHEDEYPVLLEKLEKTGKFVCSTEETLLKAKEAGIKLSFVANYNMPLVPVNVRSDSNGDMVLETELASNHATVAKLGGTLSEEQLAAADPAYVSADKVIDASTALFKDSTWFIKDARHVAANFGTQYSDFTIALLECESQPTINTFPEYPQFMVADPDLALSPLK